MGMLDKIENLREKPESYRKKVLFAAMSVIMALTVFIWVSTFNLPLLEKQKEEVISSAAPLEVLKGDWDNLRESVKSPIKDAKNIFNSVKDSYEKRGQ